MFIKVPTINPLQSIIQVDVFWLVTPCSDVAEYQCFWGPCSLHLHKAWLEYWWDFGKILYWVFLKLCTGIHSTL